MTRPTRHHREGESPDFSAVPIVILCGGRGSRLGSVTETLPKAMVDVHDKPLLWYIFLTLYNHGFHKFIFPLGYRGEMIRDFLSREFREFDCNLLFFQTGEDTPIAGRLKQITHLIPENGDFFLINGDTFFDFDMEAMYLRHIRESALLTLSSVEIVSSYGLILERNGEIDGFARDLTVSHLNINDSEDGLRGYVNSGLTLVNKAALSEIDLEKSNNFEHDLFPKIIRRGRVAHFKIEGDWFPIDTQKDLNVINARVETSIDIGERVKLAKKNLAQRYTYRTRYFDDVYRLKQEILNKTVVPHQVEVQPGPRPGTPICWLRCPYCYGGSSVDDNSRLSPERFVEIMRQIAEGGVKKIIFAGYATDPLNYGGISDLLEVALEHSQVTGFHTKALRVGDRLQEQLTRASITPLSYFSVSVDAGTNKTYNIVHGVPESKAKLYDKVVENVKRIVDARARTGAPLDLSATYLLNSHNNSTEEVRKAIQDLSAAGIDLIRFSFPQVPRGYEATHDDNIPSREHVDADMDRLRPIIEEMNSEKCQVLIMDLDKDYDTYLKPRTLPCFARFIFPSIGFDGYLSHCSESAAPHFREMALGNLMERDFWDLFYDYSINDFESFLDRSAELMCRLNCKCDRKEHAVNSKIQESGVFPDSVAAAD